MIAKPGRTRMFLPESSTTVKNMLDRPTNRIPITELTDLLAGVQGQQGDLRGPDDIVSGATRRRGPRAYTLASIGANGIRLRRNSDQAEQDVVR